MPARKPIVGIVGCCARELYRAGKYAAATRVAKKLLALGEREFGRDHLQVATALDILALLYRAQGRYPEMEPLYKRVLAIYEKSYGPDHLAVAIARYLGRRSTTIVRSGALAFSVSCCRLLSGSRRCREQ